MTKARYPEMNERNLRFAKILSEYFPTNKDRANARVLDLAAGTGLVGKDLHKKLLACNPP